MTVKMMAAKHSASNDTGSTGQTIKAGLPYIRNDIPIVVVFRALNVIADKDILDHICYDRNDTELLDMMKPCLQEAFPIQDQEVGHTWGMQEQ